MALEGKIRVRCICATETVYEKVAVCLSVSAVWKFGLVLRKDCESCDFVRSMESNENVLKYLVVSWGFTSWQHPGPSE